MLLQVLTVLANQAPKDEDVVAGPWGAIVLVALLGAVVFLGFSLVKQLRKAQAAEDAGLYDPSDKKPRVQLEQDKPTETD